MRKAMKFFVSAAIIILLFSLTPTRAGAGDDGHCVVGATTGSTSWFFAEGCTRPGFNTFLCLGNSNPEAVNAHVAYFLGDGSVREKDYPWLPLPFHRAPAGRGRTGLRGRRAGRRLHRGDRRAGDRGGAPHVFQLRRQPDQWRPRRYGGTSLAKVFTSPRAIPGPISTSGSAFSIRKGPRPASLSASRRRKRARW